MSIPSGDLAPARRRRGYRRPSRRLPGVAVAVVLALVGAVFWLQRDGGSDRGTLAARPCALPSASAPAAPATARLPLPATVRLRLLNGTSRDGLARAVATELARRGFVVAARGNAPRPVVGPARVYFGPGARPAAELVAAQVSGAQLAPVPTAPRGALDLVLGSSFVRLRTPAETAAYLGGAPAAQPSPSSTRACP